MERVKPKGDFWEVTAKWFIIALYWIAAYMFFVNLLDEHSLWIKLGNLFMLAWSVYLGSTRLFMAFVWRIYE
jgi:hypothetical protein